MGDVNFDNQCDGDRRYCSNNTLQSAACEVTNPILPLPDSNGQRVSRSCHPDSPHTNDTLFNLRLKA
jgi:hypothetical protein